MWENMGLFKKWSRTEYRISGGGRRDYEGKLECCPTGRRRGRVSLLTSEVEVWAWVLRKGASLRMYWARNTLNKTPLLWVVSAWILEEWRRKDLFSKILSQRALAPRPKGWGRVSCEWWHLDIAFIDVCPFSCSPGIFNWQDQADLTSGQLSEYVHFRLVWYFGGKVTQGKQLQPQRLGLRRGSSTPSLYPLER